MKIILLGSSITSSRKSDYATTYRCLVDELATRGHDVLFLERRIPLPHLQIDIPQSHHGRSQFYDSLDDLKRRFITEVDSADCVMMDSLVSEGHALATWLKSTATGITAFLDLTPTMARINSGYDLHLSAGLSP